MMRKLFQLLVFNNFVEDCRTAILFAYLGHSGREIQASVRLIGWQQVLVHLVLQ